MLEALVASSTDAKAMTPGNNESAGKRMSGKTRKGSPHLRSLLIEAALAVRRTNDNYLAGQYHQVAKRRGKKKAAVAVGHTILVIVYHLLEDETTYQELGHDYYDKRDREAKQHYVRKLEALGNRVTLEPLRAVA